MKAFFAGVLSLIEDGYYTTTDWIERHPQITFWIVLLYVVIRR